MMHWLTWYIILSYIISFGMVAYAVYARSKELKSQGIYKVPKAEAGIFSLFLALAPVMLPFAIIKELYDRIRNLR